MGSDKNLEEYFCCRLNQRGKQSKIDEKSFYVARNQGARQTKNSGRHILAEQFFK